MTGDHRGRTAWIAIAVAILVAGASPTHAEMASIHASYVLSLVPASSDGPLEAVSGAYDVDLVQTCDGWSYVNNTVRRVTMRGGRRTVETFEIGGIESGDGRRLAFRVRVAPPDGAVVSYRGIAEMTDAGGGRLQVEGSSVVGLPPGTLFPSQLALALLEQADAGTATAEYSILAGALDQPWRVRFEIQPAANSEVPQGPGIDSRLLGGRSWRIRASGLAGAHAGDAAGYAITSWTFENGVVAEYVYDYGAFAIRARLERLATRPRPTC